MLLAAQQMLLGRVHVEEVMNLPQDVRDFLAMRLGSLEHEGCSRCCIWTSTTNRVIDDVETFRGTLTQPAVYPRARCSRTPCAATAPRFALVDNHPSGLGTPSCCDELLTQTLQTTLALVDVRVIVRMIVAGPKVVSIAELRLLWATRPWALFCPLSL